jgi:ataxin-7
MGFAATELPRQNSSGSGVGTMGGERGAEDGNSGSGRSSKEYDPNRHCGVWVEEEKSQCTRSLTCKFHPLSQKGRVQGRSRPFAELLDEHRRRKKLKKQGKLSGGGHTPSLPLPSPSEPPPLTAHPLYPPPHPDRPTPPTFHPELHPNSAPFPHTDDDERGGGEWVTGEEQSEEDEVNSRDLPSRQDYPKPLAVCSFGARSTRCGSSVFGRRSDHLRSLLVSLSRRSKEFTETTLHR